MLAQTPELSTRDQYVERFTDVRYWRPYVEVVCQRHHLHPCHDIRCHIPGSFPTFIISDRWVVKFFGRLFNGEASYASEIDANRLVADDGSIPAAALLAHGELLPSCSGWRWPYLVFSYIPGASLGEVFDEIPFDDRLAVARQLGRVARRIHAIPIGNGSSLRPGWDAYATKLQSLYRSCVDRQCEWHTLPAHLIDQLDDYLQTPDLLVDTASRTCFLHGDITGDHVLGELVSGHWAMRGLIDFGDALVGDPAYELIAIHLDAFRCDKRLLGAYLEAYGIDRAQWLALVHKVMSLSLLHQFNVFTLVHHVYPSIAQSSTLESLAARIWDPDAPGLTRE